MSSQGSDSSLGRRGRAPGRPARYGRNLLPVLERIWLASDQLSGKLLRPILPALVTALERHHGVVLAPAVRAALLAASPATLELGLSQTLGTLAESSAVLAAF